MMISPETYYEFELKGKSEEEIQDAIRSLKTEISDLKWKMEDPDYKPEMVMPSDDTVLYWTREYLAMAKKALLEAGGEYAQDEGDRRSAELLENLPYLTKLEFYMGSCFDPADPLVISCDSEELRWSEDRVWRLSPDSCVPTSRAELLARIRELHLDEWQPDYWPDKYGVMILDGIQWELTMEFSNGHEPWKILGSNAYPFNFREFLATIGEDWQFYDEDDFEEDEDGE